MLWTSVEMASFWQRGQALVSILQNFRVERDVPCWKCWSVTCYLLQLVTFWLGLLGKGILTMFSASFFLLTKLFMQHTNVAGFLFQFSSDACTSFPQLSLCPVTLAPTMGLWVRLLNAHWVSLFTSNSRWDRWLGWFLRPYICVRVPYCVSLTLGSLCAQR